MTAESTLTPAATPPVRALPVSTPRATPRVTPAPSANPRPRPGLVALVCGLVTAVVTVVTQWASRRPDFHPSLLLNVAETDALAGYIRPRDPGFRFVTPADHYDGVYFYAMARDPLALGQTHELIDLAAYRYGHPFYAWLAGLLSGGSATALPWMFWAMSIASMAAAAVLVALLAARMGASPWWGLLVAASPGLLFSATTALTEPFQVALVAAVLLVWLRGQRARPLTLGVLVVALCLTKEQLVLVPLALGLHLVAQMWARRRFYWGRAVALAAGPLALGLWLLHVRNRFSAEQQHYDDGNVGAPILGWLETFSFAGMLRASDFHASQIGSTVVPGLVATAVVLVIGSIAGLRLGSALGLVVALQTVLVACLGWRTLLYPHEMFRIPSVALVLASLSVAVALSGRRPTGGGIGLPHEQVEDDAIGEQSAGQRQAHHVAADLGVP